MTDTSSRHAEQVDTARDYAIISKHEKGFWQIDVYWKRELPLEEGDVPDHVKTCKIGEPVEAAVAWASQWYVHAETQIVEDNEDGDDR